MKNFFTQYMKIFVLSSLVSYAVAVIVFVAVGAYQISKIKHEDEKEEGNNEEDQEIYNDEG